MDKKEIAQMIDHTLLKPDATMEQIKTLCEEAHQYGFKTVCVNPCQVAQCFDYLNTSKTQICTVVGFPLGANTPEVKSFETTKAISEGANEIDMVMNIGALKNENDDLVKLDIQEVVNAAGSVPVKVILETCLLTNEEIVKACELSIEAGASFVKTSTGFSKGGATLKNIELMKKTVGDRVKIKASGGVKNYDDAIAMIEKGAYRIGTSSGIAIVS